MSNKKKILLTGATGYVGGHLYNHLKSKKVDINLAVRNPSKVTLKTNKSTNIIKANFTSEKSIKAVEKSLFTNIDTAYYLIHNMLGTDTKSFDKIEAECAKRFLNYCKKYKVKKIVYLGGLGEQGDKNKSSSLSKHLNSRHNVGQILSSSTIPCIEFRASIVIGNGSFSYEMIRSLMHLLPFLPWTDWANSLSQPIFIDDLIFYLSKANSLTFKKSEIYEIGGAEIVKYGDLLKYYSKVNNLKRPKVNIPYVTPTMAGLVFEILAPEFKQMGPILLESIIHDTIVTNDKALKKFKHEPIKILKAFKLSKSLREKGDKTPNLVSALFNLRLQNISESLSSNNEFFNNYQKAFSQSKNPDQLAIKFFEDVIGLYKKEQVNKWFKDYPEYFSSLSSKYKDKVPVIAQTIIDKLKTKRK